MKKISIYGGKGIRPLITYLLLLISITTQASTGNPVGPQQSTVTGIVTDSNGWSLEGVHVREQSKSLGTVTGPDGAFTIEAGPNDVLIFTMIGYKVQTIPIEGKDTLYVQLEEEVTELDGVVLNAGYYSVSEKERTGSIAKVTGEVMERQPVNNPLNALQGRMAGVQITQTNNMPGAAATIQIRGQNSLRAAGNYPLYIIDGVPISSAPVPGLGALALGVDPLNTLNLSNIESIEVLKDADATAIYGSRGANGVVLITTKKGSGGKTSINLNTYTGLGKVSNAIEVLDTSEYLEMRREAFANDVAMPLEFNAPDLLLWDQERNVDWQEILLGNTAYITDVQASISGGSTTTTFLVGGGLHRETMVFPGNFGYRKATFNLNLGHVSENQKFRLSLSANYGVDRNRLFFDSQFVQKAILLAPNAPALYDENGELNWESSSWNNPLADLRKTQELRSDNLVANLSLSYRVLPGLDLKGNLGYSKLASEENYRNPISAYDPAIQPFLLNSSNHQTVERRSIIWEPQLEYIRDFGEFGLEALVGATFQEANAERLYLLAEGYADESLMGNLANANTLTVALQDETEYRYSALFGRLGLNWSRKYFLNLTGRRDGSSRFAPGRRFSNFGAIGAAWVFSEEALFKENHSFISFGKLRGSFGVTGNDQIPDYGYLDAFAPTNGDGGLYPIRLGDPDYSWERNKKLEAGLSLGFLSNRLMLNTNWYRNRSSNQLVGYNLPALTGFTSIQANLPATVENRGWEFELTARGIRLGKLEWETAFNITVPKNELLAFPDLEQSSYASQYRVGASLQSTLLYQSLGVNPETGSYEVLDANGDGAFNLDDRIVVRDFGRIYFGGLDNALSLGNLRLDFFFEFVKQLGRNHLTTFPTPAGWLGFVGGNQPKTVLARWQQEGDVTDTQRFTQNSGFTSYSRTAGSDLSVTDASYIRLRTLSLSYDVPMGHAKVMGMSGCTIYLHAQNLFTWTGFDGLDPQANRTTLFLLPPLRTVSMGVNLKF